MGKTLLETQNLSRIGFFPGKHHPVPAVCRHHWTQSRRCPSPNNPISDCLTSPFLSAYYSSICVCCPSHSCPNNAISSTYFSTIFICCPCCAYPISSICIEVSLQPTVILLCCCLWQSPWGLSWNVSIWYQCNYVTHSSSFHKSNATVAAITMAHRIQVASMEQGQALFTTEYMAGNVWDLWNLFIYFYLLLTMWLFPVIYHILLSFE